MLKLRRLRVEKFRNLARNAELSFSDGINVVLGQNGTGKTTLLELISMVVRSDFSGMAKEEFAVEYELSVGDVVITVALSNQRQGITSAVMPQDAWRPNMDARLEKQDSKIHLRVESSRLRVNGGLVETPDMGKLLGPTTIATYLGAYGLRELLVPLLTNLETVRFDESLDVFRALMGAGRTLAVIPVWRSSPQPHFVPYKGPVLIPQSMFTKLEPLYQQDPTSPRFLFSDQDLGFLRSATQTMGFASGQAEIDVLARRSGHGAFDEIDLGNLTFRFQFKHDGVDMVSHDRLSYGQKRLLTFFCYLDMCPDIVVADELVNGLHHAWITAAIDAIGSRQAFLTSQNPILLDYLAITSLEQVRSSFIFCHNEHHDGRPRWSWENMSDADAEELFRAYEIGIEHVSEILQSRGLW